MFVSLTVTKLEEALSELAARVEVARGCRLGRRRMLPRAACAPDHTPPNRIFYGKKFLLAQRVQLFVFVPTVPQGTLGGAYHRTYPHMHARYGDWEGGVRAVFAVLSQLLGAAKKTVWGDMIQGA
jgi:hypothetical protein